jgi:hypothetical protein
MRSSRSGCACSRTRSARRQARSRPRTSRGSPRRPEFASCTGTSRAPPGPVLARADRRVQSRACSGASATATTTGAASTCSTPAPTAEVMVAKSRAATWSLNEALDEIDVDELGADVDAALAKWMADDAGRQTTGRLPDRQVDAAQRYTLGVAYPRTRSTRTATSPTPSSWRRPPGRSCATCSAPATPARHRPRDGTDGDAEVVESYIYRGPDWTSTPERRDVIDRRRATGWSAASGRRTRGDASRRAS